MEQRVEEWVTRAEIDLESAELLRSNSKVYPSTLFHVHQAIEKALKAVLEERGATVPKSHDLQQLFTLVSQDPGAPHLEAETLNEVNAVYLMSRYPPAAHTEDDAPPTAETIDRLVRAARTYVSRITDFIQRSTS
jgi:HEPN domain-containing protein